MAIVNRDLDASEQREVWQFSSGSTLVAGATIQMAIVPYNVAIQAVRVASVGLTGTPTGLLNIQRFVVGSGLTQITGGFTTLTLQVVGTSGLQTLPLASGVSLGSTLLACQSGDVLVWRAAGAGSVDNIAVAVVVQALVDIKNQFNAF